MASFIVTISCVPKAEAQLSSVCPTSSIKFTSNATKQHSIITDNAHTHTQTTFSKTPPVFYLISLKFSLSIHLKPILLEPTLKPSSIIFFVIHMQIYNSLADMITKLKGSVMKFFQTINTQTHGFCNIY